MYELIRVRDKVRVPPSKFGTNLSESILNIIQEQYEGILDEDIGVIIAVLDVSKTGDGRVILGDGAAYYETELEMLVYKPKIQEIIEGFVNEITEFGAFVRIGPIDGLVHVSQIMDEYINHDGKNSCFVGKQSMRRLKVEDPVLARVVTISLKGSISDSKIGLTMRQPFLGKKEWIEKEVENKKKGETKEGKEEKAKPEKKEKEEKGKEHGVKK